MRYVPFGCHYVGCEVRLGHWPRCREMFFAGVFRSTCVRAFASERLFADRARKRNLIQIGRNRRPFCFLWRSREDYSEILSDSPRCAREFASRRFPFYFVLFFNEPCVYFSTAAARDSRVKCHYFFYLRIPAHSRRLRISRTLGALDTLPV